MEQYTQPNEPFVPDTVDSEAWPSKAVMGRSFSRLALGLCLGLLFAQVLPAILQALVPDFDVQAHAFSLGGLCTALFTLPLMILISRKLPSQKAEGSPLTVVAFLSLVAISYACMVVGNMVGMAINSIFSPNSVNLIGELASASGLSWEMALSFVVLAPVFEELVFRKVIVDRVLPFGEWPAILFSGITFGLFHGNLTQFFYATMLGMVLAYVYIRTGNVLYTIGIHACLNFLGGVVPLLAPALSYAVLAVALAGLVLFFVNLKKIHVKKDAAPGACGAMFGNAGMIFYLLLSGLLMVLVAVIMNHPELSSGLM